MRTLGRKIIELDPARGFVAETVAASVLYTTAFVFHAPISTTQTITSAIMGVGATKRAVRGAVGRGRQHRDRLGADHPGGGRGRRGGRVLPAPPGCSAEWSCRSARSGRGPVTLHGDDARRPGPNG